jgi:hypothetical protein
MQPPHSNPPHQRPPPSSHVSTSAINAFLSPERLADLLVPFVPDGEERAFIARCIVDQGPIHHRGASYALISLVAALLERTGGPPNAAPAGESVAVPLRLPPHVSAEGDEDHVYPLRLPLAPLEIITQKGAQEVQVLVDCLLDGPAHHALANAVLVSMLGALLERLPPREGSA